MFVIYSYFPARPLKLLPCAASSVSVISQKLFLFININFPVALSLFFLCQEPEASRLRCFVNNTEDGGLTAAETGSRCNDCCPHCTLGNNQPSFVIIAGKYSGAGHGIPRSRTLVAGAGRSNSSLSFFFYHGNRHALSDLWLFMDSAE